MSATAGGRVAALVLTHDRRELLAACLDAVLAQTHPVARVHVVDNASSDGTRELLAAREDVVLTCLGRNLGGAGGFARGVEVARRDDVDWLWLMDDDAEPRHDCLERLLASGAAHDSATVGLCPVVRDRHGAIEALHRGHLRGRPRGLAEAEYATEARLGFTTFVGPLIRADVARALDPPKAELFLWADDYEYSLRLARCGALRLVPDAVIVHKDRPDGFVTRRGRLANRLLGWDVASTRWEDAWRNLLGLRNYVWMYREHEGQSALGAAGLVAQFALKALLYDERPLRRLPWLLRYGARGRRGDFDNTIVDAWPPR